MNDPNDFPLPKYPKVTDGYNTWDWPELLAFLKRLGLELPHQNKKYVPHDAAGNPIRELIITVGFDTLVNGTQHRGKDVWRWPEYRALCTRLGVPKGLWDLSTTFVFSEGEACRVTHTFMAMDTKDDEIVPLIIE